MTGNNIHPTDNDSRLLKLIGLLRPTPPRDPQVVEQSRLKYQAEVDTLIGTGELSFRKKKSYQFQSKEKINMSTFKPRFALTTLFVLAAIFLFLFGGTGLTVFAAQSALPGDALYPVKTGLEQTRLSLTSQDDQIAQIHLSLAQKRLDEIEKLIREGRYDQVGKTAAEFERQIQLVVEAIKRLSENDPARAAELATSLMTEISSYTKALTGMLANLPESVKLEVEKAIAGSTSAGLWGDDTEQVEFTGTISSQAAEMWVIAGRQVKITPKTEIKGSFSVGSTVKVHALVEADGSLTAREIEASEVGEDANENQNANTNSNENENQNGNENGNENENSNVNDNSFEDRTKFEFKGTVQTILPDQWVISGITIVISPSTEISGMIIVGDMVEVYAFQLPNGSLQALKIERESSTRLGSDDNSNDNDDDHSRSDDNSNNNDDDHSGDDDSNDDDDDHSGDDD